MKETPDFSLVLGGPLYQLMRRARLSGDVLELLRRRMVVMTLFAWVPLAALSLAEGRFWGGSAELPFLHDLELHARLLLSLPLMVLAEHVVHQRTRVMVGEFLERGLIPDSERAGFDAAIASAMRLRNSITAELFLIAFVYVVGIGIAWRSNVSALGVTAWYGALANGNFRPSLAGWWMGCVSLPLWWFLIVRWYYRLFIWSRFLWQVSRLELQLLPTHPDRCGGLGFLAMVSQAFAPLLLAQGVVLAGVMANHIFFAGGRLPEFKVLIIGLVAVLVSTILGPLLVFLPKLDATRRRGLREYGALAQRYAREFDQKWLRGGAPPGEMLIGSADIQSLADLGNSFEVVKEMKLAPFTLRTVLHLGVTTLIPVMPLLLTILPLEELLDQLLEVIF